MRKVVIDLRCTASYNEGHLEEAFSFPWERLRDESCGLPPREVALTAIVDGSIDVEAVQMYLERFRYAALEIRTMLEGERRVRTPPTGFCWSPNPFLTNVVEEVERASSGSGFALDVGSGTGRDMVFLASRGWSVAGIENRRRLIEQGVALAHKHGVAGRVLHLCCDIKKHYPIAPGTVDLLHICRFMHRPSLENLLRLPRTEGYVVYSHFLEGCERTVIAHPATPASFWRRGELQRVLCDSGYAVLREEEVTLPDSRPFQNILAQRKSPLSPNSSIG
ncbi:hypothetical protein TRVL_04680 [Trypanosoma vivax]|nr:hypothetical protein TRVL_04680 [Trypanosoma vivax]